MARVIDRALRRGFIRSRQFNFEILTDPDRTDSGVAHMGQGVLYRLALGVKNCLFWRNDDFGFHSSKVPAAFGGAMCAKGIREARRF